MKLSEFAVNRPVTTIMGLLCMIVLGMLSLNRLPLVFLPDVNRPFLRIFIPYRDSNPEEVDRLITRPVEGIMGTVPGLTSINSNSSSSSSSISLEFEPGRDMDMVSMEVRDRLDRVRPQLPNDMTDTPRIMRFQTTDIPTLNFGVAWKGRPEERDVVIEEVIEKRLSSINGVANVEIRGLSKRSIWVDLDQDLMRSYGISAFQLSNRLRSDNIDLPAGNVEVGSRKYNLRAIGQFRSVNEIGQLPVNSQGLRLDQVADVRYDYPKMRFLNRLNARDAVTISIFKAANANIIEVSRQVKATLAEIKADPRYQELDYQIFWDTSESILNSIKDLRSAGILGGVLTFLVLLFFLGKIGNTLVIALAIPTSIICTFFFMYISRLQPFNSELTLNIISLIGLIYAIGMVVDPSIVVLENIFRIRNEGKLSPVESALKGSHEVGMAMLASVSCNIIVFVPLIFLSGGRGAMQYVRDFGMTFCVVIVASLIVAFTLVPLLTARILKNLDPSKERRFPRLRRMFTFLVSHALRFRLATILTVVGLLWGIFLLYGRMDKEGEPFSLERRMSINMEISHSYSYDQAAGVLKNIEKELLARKEELEISSLNANLDMGRRNRASIQVFFQEAKKGGRGIEELQNAVKDLLPNQPGYVYRYGHRQGHGGAHSGLEIQLKGERMELLESYAETVRGLVEHLPGVMDVDLSTDAGEEEVRIMVDKERASAEGYSSSQISRAISAQLSSRPNSRYKSSDREIDIMVGLSEQDRLNLARLGNMEIFSGQGQRNELKNLASIETGRGPRSINKIDRLYTASVYLNTSQGGISQLSQMVTNRLSQFKMAPGYSWELGRNFQRMQQTQKDFKFAVIFSVILIYILLAALFESFVYPFIILFSVPFAMIGVAIIYVITKTNLGDISYIGILIVCGLVVNNGIILVDYINQLRSRGMARRDAIIEGVQTRLRPILMTMLTTVLGLMPLIAPILAPRIFGSSEGRATYWGPVGLAILGGLTTSTFLTLVITPTLYSLFDDLALGARFVLHRVFHAPAGVPQNAGPEIKTQP